MHIHTRCAALLVASVASLFAGARPALGAEPLLAHEQAAQEGAEVDWADRYNRAYRAAKSGDPKGFEGLLNIVDANVSAEYSEFSLEMLQCLLVEDPRSWIRAMAKINPKRVESYVEGHWLVFTMPPRCVSMEDDSEGAYRRAENEYRRRVVAGVQKVQGTKPEMALRDRILRYFRENPISH
jgi:hypothetical protein